MKTTLLALALLSAAWLDPLRHQASAQTASGVAILQVGTDRRLGPIDPFRIRYIRPLLWREGWPVAGDNVTAGTYEIESVRTGTALEMAVQGVPVGGARGRGGAGRGGALGGRGDTAPPPPIPAQDAAQVGTSWPVGSADARMAPYMLQAQQKWSITPVDNAGGYPRSPYFKITISGTERALAATADAELAVVPVFDGGPGQLWRIDHRG